MYENVELPAGMSPETLEHLMDPKNYGKLEEQSCVGVAVDEKNRRVCDFLFTGKK